MKLIRKYNSTIEGLVDLVDLVEMYPLLKSMVSTEKHKPRRVTGDDIDLPSDIDIQPTEELRVERICLDGLCWLRGFALSTLDLPSYLSWQRVSLVMNIQFHSFSLRQSLPLPGPRNKHYRNGRVVVS